MEQSKSRGGVPLIKRDQGFLRFISQGSYSNVSTLQLAERDNLRKILDFFGIIFYLVDAVYRHLKKGKTNVTRTTIENVANALTGKFPDVSFDFSRVNLLGGTLASPSATMHHIEGSNQLDFSWSVCTQCNSNKSDELMAMIYCPATEGFWCEQTLGITRADGFCTIDVPYDLRGSEVHVWLAYRSADKQSNSNSSYMGKVFIPKTEDHGKF